MFYGVHSSLGYLSIAAALAAVYLTKTLADPTDQVKPFPFNSFFLNEFIVVVQNLLPSWGMYACYGLGIWILVNHLFQTGYQFNKEVPHTEYCLIWPSLKTFYPRERP